MAMENIKLFIFAFSGVVALTVLVHAQSQSGFISIDCGLPEQSAYTDKKTGINYTSDKTFTEAGVSYNLSHEYNTDTLEEPFLTVRSFPEGMRNCYNLKPAHGYDKFLIRASFMYGNYDGKNKLPRFDLLLGADVWDSVEFTSASAIVSKEIIHVPPKNFIYVCLGNKGSGTPFISSLELRPVANSTYSTNPGTSLLLYSRLDIGSKGNETYRFKDDAYDRIWLPYTRSDWLTLSSPSKLFSGFVNQYQTPSVVMQTAAMPVNGSNGLVYDWTPSDPTLKFLAYLHFAELDESLTENQTREQNIYFSGALVIESFTPSYLTSDTIYTGIDTAFMGENLEITIKKTEESPLPPILNALELYQQKEFLQSLTNQDDVDAIKNIKAKYRVKRNWQGDPCAPREYLWQGLNCSYPDYNSSRITSLNLSSSGLSGEISGDISSLTWIQSLDLSNNTLTGPVPDFLSRLPFLTVLNLRGNNLQGLVPTGLREKGNDGVLILSVDGNPDLCLSTSCTEKTNIIGVDGNSDHIVVTILAVVVAVSVLVVAVLAILWSLKTRNQGIPWIKKKRLLDPKSRRFSYHEVVRITNKFEMIIGKGGFGTVYHGNLDDTQVAVKMLSQSSIQGYKQFQAEVELLLRVHHKNLTTLVGYCDDGKNIGLIYEFMVNGNLESHILDDDSTNADILSWEGRLRIATEAAQGLEYLHSGCKPPIVHRDVKPTNILLNEKFQAKIGDFGLSRIFPLKSETHVSTMIVGTPGYLDPEYYKSNRLKEKSDVYSFGVVLLQIITSKPILKEEMTHIIQWVRSMLAKGDIENVVDPRLQGDFDLNSVWRAVEVAMVCVSESSAKRPAMSQVVMDLNESLAIEIVRTKNGAETETKATFNQISLNLGSEILPLAR